VVIGGLVLGLFWATTSLLVSHWVYDCSPLRRWSWLADHFGVWPTRVANLHAGLDETSVPLRRIFPKASMAVWDIYEASAMRAGSIRRAQGSQPSPLGVARVDFANLPEANGALQAVFVIFAAHEIRSATMRERFFGELWRVLEPGGSVVLG